jgi:hypothetical protein
MAQQVSGAWLIEHHSGPGLATENCCSRFLTDGLLFFPNRERIGPEKLYSRVEPFIWHYSTR